MSANHCQIPTLSCPLLGAYRGSAGVEGGVVVVHSITGCLYGAARPHIQSRWHDLPHLSTVVYENEVVMGGEARLRETIQWALDNYHPSVLFVVNGCIPEIIGDDMAAIASEFANGPVPVIALSAPGFNGDETTGLLEVMRRLVGCMQAGTKRPHSVNLLGLCADDFQIDNDIKEMRSMLAPTITVNAVISYDNFENIIHAPRAEYNIVFPGFESIGELMQKEFDLPYKVLEYPYGMALSTAFIRESHALFGLDATKVTAQHEGELLRRLSPVANFVNNLGHIPCAVIGNRLFGGAMNHMLCDEMGMNVAFYDTSIYRDYYEIGKQLETGATCLIFGDTFSRGIAEKLDIPHISSFYPVLDRITCSPRTYAGYTGLSYLLEDIVNAAMNCRENDRP